MTSYDWLAAVYDTAAFIAFDTETTGLDAAVGKIVEIGGVKFDRRGIIARYNVLINPQMPMPEEAGKVNGITDAMLKDKPVIAAIFPDFLEFIGTGILVAHNAPFDINYVNTELARAEKPLLTNKVVDTRIFAKEVFPGLSSYALQDLAVQFGITALEAHRAEDDARVCMELFEHTLTRFLKNNTELVEKIRAETDPASLLSAPEPQPEKDYARSLF
nr:3'-5' exonuclease [uncultured Treponema sp.]